MLHAAAQTFSADVRFSSGEESSSLQKENVMSAQTRPISDQGRRLNSKRHATPAEGEGADVLVAVKARLRSAHENAMRRKPRSPDHKWAAVAQRFALAKAASDKACDLEFDATSDIEFEKLEGDHAPIHREFQRARTAVLATDAPHWAAVALKARAIGEHWGGLESNDRWAVALRDLISVADRIGEVSPAEVDAIDLMQGRGYAEQVAYFLANRSDGYANWGAGLGQVAALARDADRLVEATRKLARHNKRHGALSALVINAVWFSKPNDDCPLAQLAKRFVASVREHDELESRLQTLSAAERERADALNSEQNDIRREAMTARASSKEGLAFQLAVAAGQMELACGTTDADNEASIEPFRRVVGNTIAMLGASVDRRVVDYFMVPAQAQQMAA